MEEKVIYFETTGKENTHEVLTLVKERAEARGITKIILASTRGDTARMAAEAFDRSVLRLVVIPPIWLWRATEVSARTGQRA